MGLRTAAPTGNGSRLWFSIDKVQCGANDRVGVDLEVVVEVINVAGLAEVGDAERSDGHPADGAEERQRVRVAIKHGYDRCRAPGREEHVKDRIVAVPEPASRLECSED
jgi:hypothetical protein